MWVTIPVLYPLSHDCSTANSNLNFYISMGIYIFLPPMNSKTIRYKHRIKYLILTLKNASVLPPASVPYLILVCLVRSSTELMGEFILAAVRKAARLAVYDEMMMSVNRYQTLATILDDIAL